MIQLSKKLRSQLNKARKRRARRKARLNSRHQFQFESLEDRRLLTAAPTVSIPGAQSVDEGQTLDVPAITVGDVDSSSLWVALWVDSGTLTLGTDTGLTFLGGSSNGASALVIEGVKADLNAALATLDYQGNPGFSGADSLNVTVFDSTTYDYVGAVLSTPPGYAP